MFEHLQVHVVRTGRTLFFTPAALPLFLLLELSQPLLVDAFCPLSAEP